MPQFRRSISPATLLAFALLAGAACNSKSADAKRAAAAQAPAAESSETRASSGSAASTPTTAPHAPGELHDSRKVIRTGRIALLVGSYDDARAKLDALVAAAGGYVDSTEVNRRQNAVSDATIVVRAPSDAFGALVPKLRELGEIVSETTNANDITDQYVDIAARVASARTLEKRLLELATDRAGNIDQVLSVERELARVRGEIEGYEGHLRQWDDQIAMSTLTLSLETKRPEIVAAATREPSLGERTSHALGGSMSALRDFCSWVVVNGVAFLPWLLVLVPGVIIGRKLGRRLRPRLPFARATKGAAPIDPPTG